MHLRRITLNIEKYPTSDKYPFNLKLLQATQDIVFKKPVTLFVGENGTGKSTLLKAICLKCGIHIWKFDEGGRFEVNPFEEQLYKFIDVEWIHGSVPGSYFASQIFQDFTELLDEWATASPKILEYFGGSSLMTKSHGQSLLSFFKSRYKIKGIYFLDEPETALSPTSQLELLKLIQKYSQGGLAQFIIATHSPILLACPDAQIYNLDSIPLKSVNYEETEHFRIYQDFMQNRHKYLDNI
jgi:predicted ATPase